MTGLGAILFLGSLADPGDAEVRQKVEAVFEAFNARDMAGLEALYAPNASITSSDFCTPRSPADIRRTYQRLFDGHPDVRDVVDVIIVDDERAAVRFHAIAESGARPLNLQLTTFFRFEDGLIIEDDTVFDTGGAPCDP